MRKWLRERVMRRRKKSPETEQTGRIGQERPAGAAPLIPSYDFDSPGRTEPRERFERPDRPERPQRQERPERQQRNERPDRDEARANRVEIETQPESLASPLSGQAIPVAPHRQPRQPRGVVVLTIGLPGSGKSTWYKRRGITPLSSDLLRTILFDNITEQRYQHLVFSTLRSLLRARLIAKMPWNYVDATNLSPHERKQWIKMSKGFGYDVQAVFFDVPVEVCLERNRRRERVVPEDVMRRMASKLKPPTFTEGFSKIVVVRVKGSAGAEGAEAVE
ncbi:MAG: AAA family ATPase [Candidatus Koribacter versatilis]|uniref:AAA family ATPase n=1 Tax=Candidatus Korobacter versatilis TaxID=658062 RepID=A0A932A669_9BACT|nr:AAA family ATPase [Candidatus Koribacter versatilis]